MKTKPPLGIEPKWLWEERRMWGLIEAVARYARVGQPIPTDWLEELEYKLRDRRIRSQGGITT